MATWFWVAAAPANFASVNWATSSGGTASGQPTTGDTAILDGGSAQTCTIAASVSLASLDCQGGTGNFAGTLTHNTAVTLTITGTTNALRLSSGMVYNPATTSSLVTFTNTSGTAQLTSAGQAFNAMSRNGAGGTTQQQDNLLVNGVANSVWTLTSGTWDCNGHNTTACETTVSGATARTLLMGGVFTLGGNVGANQTLWNAGTSTNFTLTPNSGSFVVLPFNTGITGVTINLGSVTSYPGWTFNQTTTAGSVVLSYSNATIASLSIGYGWAFLVSTTTLTISTAFTWTGTSSQPIMWIANAVNAGALISCPSGNCILTWGVLLAIQANGGATFTANSTLALATSGWATTPPSQLTIAGIATGVWQDLLSSSDFTTAGSAGALLAAVANLQYTVPAIARGTVGASASTTSIPTSAFSPAGAAANQFAGRVVLFDAATATTALRGQVATISASTNAATPTLTVSALTTAPASGDTFSVL